MLLARSPTTTRAEEYAIHDYDGFGTYPVGEYEPINTVMKIARGIAVHGLAFAAWAARCEGDDEHAARFLTSRVRARTRSFLHWFFQALVLIRALWSGILDLNQRPHRPERCALPGCANPRIGQLYQFAGTAVRGFTAGKSEALD